MVSITNEKPSKKKIFRTLGLSGLFFLFVLIGLFGIAVLNMRHTKDTPVLSDGTLDMGEWDFEKKGMNFLETGWSFYPGLLLEPFEIAKTDNEQQDMGAALSSFDAPHYQSVTLSARGWKQLGADAFWTNPELPPPDLNKIQVGTYHISLKVSQSYKELTMDFQELNQAAKIFVNGKLVHLHGSVSPDQNVFVSNSAPAIVTVEPNDDGLLDIVIQTASFSSPYAGMACVPGIGLAEHVAFLSNVARIWLTSVFTLLFLIVMIGFYVSFTFENRNKYYYFILLIFSALAYDFFDRSYNPLAGNWNNLLQLTIFLVMAIFAVMYFSSLFSKDIGGFFKKLIFIDKYVIISILLMMIIYFWLRQNDLSSTIPIWVVAVFVCIVNLYIFAKVLYCTIRSKHYGAFHIISSVMAIMIFATMLMRTQHIFYIPLHSISIMTLILGTVMYFTIQYVGTNNQVSRFTMELELAVQEKTRNIAKVNSELLLANKRLVENEDARKKMMSNVSHDLRTPITAIRGYIELLLRAGCDIPPETHETYLRNMHTRCMQMEQLIEDLMQLTRLESGEVSGEMETLSVKDIISSLTDLYESELQNSDKKITLDLPSNDELLVNGDPNNLLRVFDNLLVNALRYTGDQADIRISALRESNTAIGDVIHLIVQDDGCGIPEAEIPYVFDRFYRASNSSITKNGTGLGLAIVKSIVKKHGGVVWVESKEGIGSVFHVQLPVAKTDENHPIE